MQKRRSLLLTALSLSAKLLAQDGGSPARKTFTVIGKVKYPRQFDLPDGTHVMDAFGLAGGFVDFANLKKISIIRDGQRFLFSYRDFIRGRNVEQNTLLRSGDVIEIP